MAFEDIIALEKQLLLPEKRADVAWLAEVIAEDFEEIGASGKIYNATAIMSALLVEDDDSPVRATSFLSRELTPDLVMINYETSRRTDSVSFVRRTSIWRRRGDSWQIIFHQGTPVA